MSALTHDQREALARWWLKVHQRDEDAFDIRGTAVVDLVMKQGIPEAICAAYEAVFPRRDPLPVTPKWDSRPIPIGEGVEAQITHVNPLFDAHVERAEDVTFGR